MLVKEATGFCNTDTNIITTCKSITSNGNENDDNDKNIYSDR